MSRQFFYPTELSRESCREHVEKEAGEVGLLVLPNIGTGLLKRDHNEIFHLTEFL
jgi:hypothetical protein